MLGAAGRAGVHDPADGGGVGVQRLLQPSQHLWGQPRPTRWDVVRIYLLKDIICKLTDTKCWRAGALLLSDVLSVQNFYFPYYLACTEVLLVKLSSWYEISAQKPDVGPRFFLFAAHKFINAIFFNLQKWFVFLVAYGIFAKTVHGYCWTVER